MPLTKITIEYPLDGSVFPPEITPPTFLWRDEAAKRWVVEVSFAGQSDGIRLEVPGELMTLGELDPQTAPELSQLTPEQASTRTWTPDANTWAKIKRLSVKSPATIVITGFADANLQVPVSGGSVNIATSQDPVGAPIFYRDVPLMLSPPAKNGPIQPLPPSAIPLIKWKIRNIGQPESRTVMENLHTCANCHSFSADGKTLGMDLDGPRNDKGLYALAPVSGNMSIRNQDVIRWSSFLEDERRSSEPAVKRFGFMSQVSPDGRYVVTSIAPPGTGNVHGKELPDLAPGIADCIFGTNYSDVHFLQVFYPTRGILAFYDRQARKLRPLPGADDSRFVHTSAFWSPDGKYLIFSRAKAIDPYPPGAKKPDHANDPNEPQIQYDLYRIPFNGGKGGKAEPVVGASENGMSNNFPKVSPDGRWIVFVQNRNGLLMRPDSKLYIVPFEGGNARLMKCNTSLMNSWHSFSPNGRWLAFSSKARRPHTQLMLTHIDRDGNDTPPILVDNMTAANRAVNIPEFVNVAQDGIEKIKPEAVDYYRLLDEAGAFVEKERWSEAIPVLREAVQVSPDDGVGHYALATVLSANGQEQEAVGEYRKACALDSSRAAWFAHLAVSLANTGNLEEAVFNWRKSLVLNPSDAGAETDLGTALFELGHTQEGYEHLRKAIDKAPNFPDAHNRLGWALAKARRLDEATEQLEKAIALNPKSAEFRANLGYVLELRGDLAGAITAFQNGVELSKGTDPLCLSALAKVYQKTGRFADAIQAANQALALAIQHNDKQLEKKLRSDIQNYERSAADATPR